MRRARLQPESVVSLSSESLGTQIPCSARTKFFSIARVDSPRARSSPVVAGSFAGIGLLLFRARPGICPMYQSVGVQSGVVGDDGPGVGGACAADVVVVVLSVVRSRGPAPVPPPEFMTPSKPAVTGSCHPRYIVQQSFLADWSPAHAARVQERHGKRPGVMRKSRFNSFSARNS